MRRRTARMAVARGDAGFAVRGYAIMKRGYLFIALATLFFSTMEIALKEVAGLFNPVQLNLTRFLIGGLVLIPFARRMLRKRGVRIDGLSLVKLAWLGFLGIVVSMTLYQLAVENTNASVVAVLFSCNPVFVLVFAGLILRTQILRQHVMALVLECLGILILINPLDTSISTAGITFTLLSTAVFALYAVLGTKMCAKYSGVVVTCGSFLFASLEMAAGQPPLGGRRGSRGHRARPFRGYPPAFRVYPVQRADDAVHLRRRDRGGLCLLLYGDGGALSDHRLIGLLLQARPRARAGLGFSAGSHSGEHGGGRPVYPRGFAGFAYPCLVHDSRDGTRKGMVLEAGPGLTPFRRRATAFSLFPQKKPGQKPSGLFCGGMSFSSRAACRKPSDIR